MTRPFRTACLGAAAAAAMACGTARAEAQLGTQESPEARGAVEEEVIEAIWRIERFEFTYFSTHVYYSCDALKAKIVDILRALGAHQRVAIRMECGFGRLVNNAYVRVAAALPVAATRENVIAATTYDSRTRLMARVRKLSLPTANDIERFPAAWQTISLSRLPGLRLEAGDCDLLRGLLEQVFPKLDIKTEPERLRCSFGTGTRLRPKVEVSALLPVESADDETAAGG